jgi:Sulfatase
MRNLARQFTLVAFAFGTFLSLRTAAQDKPLRPNVVYIVSDDQGWKDVGYHGSDIRTPNLDELATAGARLAVISHSLAQVA